VFSLFFACSEKANHTVSLINDNNDLKESTLDSMFSLLRYIKLETIPESLIGDKIGKIRKFNNKYYLSSDHKELLIFLEDGTFSHKISKIGNGPGEYGMLVDFDILSNNDIAILDARKILIYDAYGYHKKSIPLSIVGFNIKVINEKEILICASGEEYVIYRLDYEGKMLSKYMKNKKSTSIGSDVPFISLFQKQIIFQIGYSNNFIVYDEKVNEFSEMDFLGNNECLSSKKEDELLEQHGFEYLNLYPSLKIIFGIASYRDYMLFKWGDSTGYCLYVVDMKNDNKLIYKSVPIRGDMDGNMLKIDYPHIGVAGDCFITYVPYLDYMQQQESTTDEIVTEDENPVLMEFIVRKK
jgi:hypothetical protein